MTVNTKNNLSAVLSVCLLVATVAVSTFVGDEKEKHDEPHPIPMQMQQVEDKDCDVVVISVDVGDGPFLLWSNHKAKCNEDGTVTVETRCEGDAW